MSVILLQLPPPNTFAENQNDVKIATLNDFEAVQNQVRGCLQEKKMI